MSDFNNFSVSGHIVRDAVLKTIGSTSLAEFSVASNRRFGEKEETLFMDVNLWGKRAESLVDHLVKGKYIIVSGPLKQDNWDTENGRRTKYVLNADTITFTPGKSGNSVNKSEDDSQEEDDTHVPF